MQLYLYFPNHLSHRSIPFDSRSLRTDNTTSGFFCPTAPCLESSNYSVMLVELNSGFSGTPAFSVSSFPMAISAFSSQQPLVHGPKFLAGLPRRTMELLFPDSQDCTVQSRLPRRWRASDSAGPLAPLFQLPCACFLWQEEALGHHFIFHLWAYMHLCYSFQKMIVFSALKRRGKELRAMQSKGGI